MEMELVTEFSHMEMEMGFQQRLRKKRPKLAKALLSPMADLCNLIPFFSFFFYKGNIFLLIFVVADLIFMFLI
jgi:hypothetical protein